MERVEISFANLGDDIPEIDETTWSDAVAIMTRRVPSKRQVEREQIHGGSRADAVKRLKAANLTKEMVMKEAVKMQKRRNRWRELNCVYTGRPNKQSQNYTVPDIGKGSFLASPFTVKEFGLQGSLRLYRKYIRAKGSEKDGGYAWKNQIWKLRNKRLGCFCSLDADCHVDEIIRYIEYLRRCTGRYGTGRFKSVRVFVSSRRKR